MRSNDPRFPVTPGGPYAELRLMLALRSTLCEILRLPVTTMAANGE